MKSWKTERDRLIEDTLAFVQSVSSTVQSTTSKLLAAELQPYEPAVVHPVWLEAPADAQQAEAQPADPQQLSVETSSAASVAASPLDAPAPTAPLNETAPAEVTATPTRANRVARPLNLKPIKQPSSSPRADLAGLSERSVIASRVAAFKAQQVRQIEEREAYVEKMQQKIRGALQISERDVH